MSTILMIKTLKLQKVKMRRKCVMATIKQMYSNAITEALNAASGITALDKRATAYAAIAQALASAMPSIDTTADTVKAETEKVPAIGSEDKADKPLSKTNL